MSNQVAAEVSSVTKATVVPGMGYPADRIEVSPAATGWQHTVLSGDFNNVSRETSR
jgi:hypothetical protein